MGVIIHSKLRFLCLGRNFFFNSLSAGLYICLELAGRFCRKNLFELVDICCSGRNYVFSDVIDC